MTLKNNKQIDYESDWNNYKMYVVECLKQLSDSQEKTDKKINDLQLEILTNLHKIKEDYQEQLRDLAKTIVPLQVRVGLICTITCAILTIMMNTIVRSIIEKLMQ